MCYLIFFCKKIVGKLKRSVQNFFFSVKWEKQNQHNGTHSENNFDIKKVTVGNYTYGGLHVSFYGDASERLTIGNFCSIGPGVQFLCGGNHATTGITTFPVKRKFLGKTEAQSNGEIVVCDDVWIGLNALILSGVTIGQGAVIAAGAVVTKDVQPYSIVGGVPAKLISYRFSENIRTKMMQMDYKSVDKSFFVENIDMIYSDLSNNEDNVNILLKKLKDRAL